MGSTWGDLGTSLIELAAKKSVPLLGQFELTARCNLQCKMCYVCKAVNDLNIRRAERTTKEWLSLAEEAREAGMLYLVLTGGEVFLRSDFETIYREMSMMGFSITLFTNGTRITPKIAAWLSQIPPSKVCVTLYGASEATYGEVCGNPAGYSSSLRGIRLLLSEGIKLKLKTTLIKNNLKDFERIAELSDQLGAPLEIVNYIAPRREDDCGFHEELRLSPTELWELEKRVERQSKIKERKNKYLRTKGNEAQEQSLYLQRLPQLSTEHPFPCTAGRCSFWVTWDGRMLPCGLMEEPATEPFHNGFTLAWEELLYYCDRLPVCEECNSCPHKQSCITCPARLKGETGYFDQPAPYLCKLYQCNTFARR